MSPETDTLPARSAPEQPTSDVLDGGRVLSLVDAQARPLLPDPTTRAQAAVDALRELIDAEGADAAIRAFAEAVAPELEARQANRVGKPHPLAHLSIFETLPSRVRDHAEFRADTRGRVAALLAQPYHVEWTDLQLAVEFAQRNGYRIDLFGESSWFPGRTFSLVVRRANDAEPLRPRGGRRA